VSTYIVLCKGVAAVAPGKAEVQVGEMRAVCRFSGPASRAAPAGLIGQHRVVAALDLPDRAADRFDHPRALVTEHDGPAGTGLADVDIRVTDATSDNAHQYFVGARRRERERLDCERAAAMTQHGGANADLARE